MSQRLSRWFNVILAVLCLVFLWSYVQARGEPDLRQILGMLKQGPKAVLTISFGERPEGFNNGEFYVLKVLQVRDTKVDFGFCRMEVEE